VYIVLLLRIRVFMIITSLIRYFSCHSLHLTFGDLSRNKHHCDLLTLLSCKIPILWSYPNRWYLYIGEFCYCVSFVFAREYYLSSSCKRSFVVSNIWIKLLALLETLLLIALIVKYALTHKSSFKKPLPPHGDTNRKLPTVEQRLISGNPPPTPHNKGNTLPKMVCLRAHLLLL